MNKKVKALVLFSGGLDSRLVIKILSSRNLNKSNSDSPQPSVERLDQIDIIDKRRPSPFDKKGCPKSRKSPNEVRLDFRGSRTVCDTTLSCNRHSVRRYGILATVAARSSQTVAGGDSARAPHQNKFGAGQAPQVPIWKEQKINLLALHFVLPFGTGCCADTTCVFNFSQVQRVPLKIIDCTRGKNFRDYLKIIKKPKFGYGSGLNPCIDCRIFMLKKAKKLMKKLDANFIATGEVLGERPMSQNLRALKLIEKETGLENKILRPLSAKLLEETAAEKNGLVDREKLYAISGRRRLPQIELAKKYGLKNFPTPAGGCLLCDKEFTKRFKKMLENFGDINENDAEILKLGRHFWVDNNLIVVGRNHEENLKIKKLVQKGDILIELKDIPGPTTLIRMGAFLPAGRQADTPKPKAEARYLPRTELILVRGSDAKISKKAISEAKKLTKKYVKNLKENTTFKIFKN